MKIHEPIGVILIETTAPTNIGECPLLYLVHQCKYSSLEKLTVLDLFFCDEYVS